MDKVPNKRHREYVEILNLSKFVSGKIFRLLNFHIRRFNLVNMWGLNGSCDERNPLSNPACRLPKQKIEALRRFQTSNAKNDCLDFLFEIVFNVKL